MKTYSIEIKWALLFTVMSLTWMTLEKLSGLHDKYIEYHPIYTNFIAIPAITIYVLALLDKKKNFYHGSMTYREGFITGILITLIVTALSPVSQIITSTVITPDYFQNAIDYAVKHQKSTQAEAEAFFNLKNYLIQGLIGAPIMGLMTTAIVAFFVKSKSTNQD